MRRRAFILTEILTGLMLQSMFVITLFGAFYMVLTFGTATQQTLAASDSGQIVISYVDNRIRNAGVGLWKCGRPLGVAEALGLMQSTPTMTAGIVTAGASRLMKPFVELKISEEMKRHIMILSLVMLAFAACQKSDDDLITLNVELGNYAAPDNAKMYVDARNYTHWTSGDQVKINNYTCTVDISGSKAQITGVQQNNYGYTAVYPASIATKYFGATTTNFDVNLPSTQTYAVDGSGKQIITAPMIARCNAGGSTLTFQNLCSLLKVTVNNNRDEDIDMQSITLTSSSGNLSGVAKITNATTSPSFAMGTGDDSYNYVTLSFSSETVGQRTSKSYYIVVPAFSESDITISIIATSTGTL